MNFQVIIWELRVSLPHGSSHLHLGSWWSEPCACRMPRSSVPRRKAKYFQKFGIFLLACHCSEMSTFEISSFLLSISRFRHHSFHVFFLCPTKLRPLLFGVMLHDSSAQPAQQLCSNLSTSLDMNQHIKINSHSGSVTARQSIHWTRSVHI